MRKVADQHRIPELVERLAALIERDVRRLGADDAWALVGIRSRGDILADRLSKLLDPAVVADRVGTLDITMYRDDLSEIGAAAVVRTTDIPFAIDGLNVVLVDDVIMTGRSIRAAMQSLMDVGRPRRVWLAVLVDRGGRELPIQPDHVALDLSRATAGEAASANETVEVRLTPLDDQDAIYIRQWRDASEDR